MHYRHAKMLDWLKSGPVSIKVAAQKLGVTTMTVRRDIREMYALGLVLPVKGGVILNPACYEPEATRQMLTPEKFAIANALYDEIMPCKSIFISTGFTALAFAKTLMNRCRSGVSVVTNSLPVASTLFRTKCQVVLLGGELRNTSLDLVGHVAEQAIENFKVDYLVTGCDAAAPEDGFFTCDTNLRRLERLSIKIAKRIAVITESRKFSIKTSNRYYSFASPREIDLLITDTPLPEETAATLRNSGIRIITAPPLT